jgi:[NiFe] hydrogenase diaphorase moiety large subunit
MTVAGYAIGAQEGLLYLRAEYAYLLPALEATLASRRAAGLLGNCIQGQTGFDFDIRIQLGAGAYICGEESALIESLEGRRGAPRHRPPFPVQRGYKGQPTSVNNVETLCCAARIVEQGSAWFAAMGTKDSTGTKLLSVSGDCAKPGVYEVEYGLSIAELLQMVGAAGAPVIGQPVPPNEALEIAGLEDVQAVQVGGPSGICIGPESFKRKIAFEDLPTGGSMIVFGKNRDLLALMTAFTEFFAEESCGWCVPCRVGTTLLAKKMERILEGKGTSSEIVSLEELAKTVKTMSRCGLGQTAANPILSTLAHFPNLYAARLRHEDYVPVLDLDTAMQACCSAANRSSIHEEGV